MHDRVLAVVDKPWRLNAAAGISLTSDGDRVAVALTTGKKGSIDAGALVVSRRTGTVTQIHFPVPAYPAAWIEAGRELLAVTLKSDAECLTQPAAAS